MIRGIMCNKSGVTTSFSEWEEVVKKKKKRSHNLTSSKKLKTH